MKLTFKLFGLAVMCSIFFVLGRTSTQINTETFTDYELEDIQIRIHEALPVPYEETFEFDKDGFLSS